MKKSDFRRQLKSMNIEKLKELKSKELDYMLSTMILDDKKEWNKHSRYLGYIEDAIKKLQRKENI